MIASKETEERVMLLFLTYHLAPSDIDGCIGHDGTGLSRKVIRAHWRKEKDGINRGNFRWTT